MPSTAITPTSGTSTRGVCSSVTLGSISVELTAISCTRLSTTDLATGTSCSRRSGGSKQYKTVVNAALHLCDKFMVVTSQNSIRNEWVRAEVDSAVKSDRLIILCLFDDSDVGRLHAALAQSSPLRLSAKLSTVDFRVEIPAAQERLAEILDRLLSRSPYPRFPRGRPARSKKAVLWRGRKV
jgi:hypothetical protein